MPSRPNPAEAAARALDAPTGKELWAHPNEGAVGARGMNYWQSVDGADRRLDHDDGVGGVRQPVLLRDGAELQLETDGQGSSLMG